MFDIFKMSWMEYKKIFCKKSNSIGLGIFFLICFVGIEEILKSNFNVNVYNEIFVVDYTFSLLASFIIFFQSVTIFTDEFKFGTSSLIFSGIKSRTEIILSKVLAMILFSITFALADFVLIYYCCYLCKMPPVSSNYLTLLIFMYFIFSWFVSNYFLLFNVIFKSRATSFILGLGVIFFLDDFFQKLIPAITSSLNLNGGVLEYILEFLPFANVMSFFDTTSLSVSEIYGMLFFGIVFFVVSSAILEKKDLA